ncbi:response regulator [Pigmentibacter sp. JX0631]|uniref:response regulator n=1 Tax=Pigmentibacter sp. JX0631 TaxID=2976982 RepID=UPI002469B296|nr:response regulator [Pigmentibacter sp. JX0631]WGL60921.1 response regulator [Pigmentibacter sp. JX0631]
MKKILIADASKASLVMTSEVFKDHYPGVQVIVARNSSEAIELAKINDNIDAFIIDYDLPDANGAQTAAKLKKQYSIPVLITAFDTTEVVQNIETTLKQYPDCQSWLKKPVNPDVVIAVAQRFCDGKIRAQKRITCNLPAIAEIILENESLVAYQQKLSPIPAKNSKSLEKTKIKTKKELKTPKKVAAKKEIIKSIPLYFCGIIEDCSLSGVKLKPSKNSKIGLTDWNQLLASMEFISSGSSVILKLPSTNDIENGKILEITKMISNQIENGKKKESEIGNNKKKSTSTKGNSIAKKAEEEKVPALATLSENTKAKVVNQQNIEDRLQSLTGKVAWTSSESGEWCVGVEFESPSLSKKLFESILSYQLKQQKNITNQSVMKTSRAS